MVAPAWVENSATRFLPGFGLAAAISIRIAGLGVTFDGMRTSTCITPAAMPRGIRREEHFDRKLRS